MNILFVVPSKLEAFAFVERLAIAVPVAKVVKFNPTFEFELDILYTLY